jgi:23S rRNA pseudouridine1911/1915/1917 synthase
LEKNNSSRTRNIEIVVSPEESGQRIDKVLSRVPEINSRSRAEYLIKNGSVTIDGQSIKSSYKAKEGQKISIFFPERKNAEDLKPYDVKIEIIYEDEDLLVINKPSGMVVHPSHGHEEETLVNAVIAHTKSLSLQFGQHRPGVVHRLDKDTSGLLVMAKNDFTHLKLAEQFKNKTTHRIYRCLSFGRSSSTNFSVSSYLIRNPNDRKKFASFRDARGRIIREKVSAEGVGKWAVTHAQILTQICEGLNYIQLRLETGRTHQIRVHLSELGLPIAADPIYGKPFLGSKIPNRFRESVAQFDRLALHAKELGFEHPRQKTWMSFSVSWPEKEMQILKNLGLVDL